MAASVLLDTCAAIWLMKRLPLSAGSRSAIRAARVSNLGVYISPFSSWEIGTLVAKGRLHLTLSPDAWFETLLGLPGIRLAALTPQILIHSTALPGIPPSDPADRIVVATARIHGFQVITRDHEILQYAKHGHVLTIAC